MVHPATSRKELAEGIVAVSSVESVSMATERQVA
jgi:hypothetical protein